MRLSLHQAGPLAGQRQATTVSSHLATPHVSRSQRLTSSAPEHRTRLVARVIEQSKSSAEAFIESVREDLAKGRLEVEESVVATDINELQQQVHDLEQQVRTK